jgi:cysteinyl-tRNA synthetase
VQINQEKMSKSLGNFFTIREIFGKSEWSEIVTGEILRYFLLSTHYHGPLDFSDQALKEAKSALNGFYDLFIRLNEEGDGPQKAHSELDLVVGVHRKGFNKAMDSDLNTPIALAELQELRGEINKLLPHGLSSKARKEAREEFRSIGKVLGLFQLEPDQWQFNPLQISVHEVVVATDSASVGIQESVKAVGKASILTDKEIESQLAERLDARKRKDFAKADEIRKSLAAQGIIIEDKPDGTSRWKR